MKKFATVAAALLVAAMPYLLYAVAQTSRLHEAVRTNDIERIRSALKPWKLIDGRDGSGATPLQIAVSRGNIIAAKFFLDNGSSAWPPRYANSQTDYLDMAVRLGEIDMVKLLLDRGAPINKGRAICSAVESLKVDIVTLLLNRGADPNALKQSHDQIPALFCLPQATRTDSRPFQIIEILIKHGANIGHYLPSGNSLLSYSMFRKPMDTEMIKFLIDHGFPLNSGPNDRTPIRDAAAARLVDAVKVLLDAGADANDFGTECKSKCRGRRTALHAAVDLQSYEYPSQIPQSIEITTTLLRHGARPNVFDEVGNSPLFLATYSNNHEAAALLKDAGADPKFAAPPDKRRHLSKASDP